MLCCRYPLFGRTVPSDHGTAEAIIAALRHHMGVTNLAVLHVDDAYATAFASGLQQVAEDDMTLHLVDMPFQPTDTDLQRIVQDLKNKDFRYIFCILYVGPSRVNDLFTLAYEQGVAGTGEHTWLFSDAVGLSLTWEAHEVGSPMHHALKGTGLIQAMGGLPEAPQMMEFHRQLELLQTKPDLDYVLSKTQFYNETVGDIETIFEGWTQKGEPEPYSPFLYDAVIAAGLAACDAASHTNGTYFDGQTHFKSFLQSDFEGSSGRVIIHNETGTREAVSTYFSLTNFVEGPIQLVNGTEMIQFQSVQSASFENGEWVEMTPFVFADGSNTPPQDLPPVMLDENHLKPGWQLIGLLMCGVVLLLPLGFAAWTGWNRKSRMVMSSQPVFLYLICIGVFIFASSIIPLSIDEGVATSMACSVSCNAVLWLASIGFAVAFTALFTKTYRVNKIFTSSQQFRRVEVTPWDVARPMIFLLGSNLLVLSLMTALSPLQWEVEVLSLDAFGRPEETRGFCDLSSGSLPYAVTLGVLNFGCLVFSLYQAYQARNISTEYAESEYIFKIQITLLLVGCLGFSLLLLTQDNSTAFYFVMTTIIFIISCAILLLVFVPKVVSLWMRQKQQQSSSFHSSRRTSYLSQPFGNNSSDDLGACSDIGIQILMPERERQLLKRVTELERCLEEAQSLIKQTSSQTGTTVTVDKADSNLSSSEGSMDMVIPTKAGD